MISKLTLVVKLFRGSYCFKKSPFCRESRIFIDNNPKVINPTRIVVKGTISCGRNAWIHAITQYFEYDYEPTIEFGDSFSCGNDFHLAATNRIIIGSNVLIGSYVLISDHSHGIYDGVEEVSVPLSNPVFRQLSIGHISIGDNVWIGDSVKILGNVSIGSGSIIGAGSIVVKDVPSNSIVCGVPARVVKVWCELTGTWVRC
ncbi:acyltransferase [Shewanella sp. ULN5]|uniref:acyltransferase n=1 Tax=Shewanella sp. ULN5 TaxID=2994678 RepID=UPI00273D4C72|nr:acyltransferase [Shewanella sp. ULN5]MDP5145072.1 acyltransferase [Shewanella sp. ULN5]